MSRSLRAYLRERMRPAMLSVVTCGLVFAARATAAHGWGILIDGVLALTLVIFLRLWDDLEDLPADRRQHPYRALVLAPSTTPFVWLTVGLGVGAALLIVVTRSAWVLLQFALVCLVAAAWYRLGRRRVHGVLAYHALLLKYPAIVLLVAQRAPVPSGVGMALGACFVYGAACLYEGWHDARYAEQRWLALVLGIDACFTAVALGHYLKIIAPLGVFS